MPLTNLKNLLLENYSKYFDDLLSGERPLPFGLLVCNSEAIMTSFPHNLILDSQPRFGFTPSEIFNLYNFFINYQIFMKPVAKCSAFLSLAYQVHVKVCNPIPLRRWSDAVARVLDFGPRGPWFEPRPVHILLWP